VISMRPSVFGRRPGQPHPSPWPATSCQPAPAAVAAGADPREEGMSRALPLWATSIQAPRDVEGVAGMGDVAPGTYGGRGAGNGHHRATFSGLR
jgi:hypothetical protein